MDKAIIFDFGGTLDTNGVHWSVKFIEIYKKFGLKFTSEQYNNAYVKADKELKLISGSIDNYKKLLLEQINLHLKFINPEGYEEKKREELAQEVINEIMIEVGFCLNESKKTFEVLKKYYKLGIVSNFYGNLERICEDIGFTKYLDVMIDSELARIEKPHPGIFSLALQKLEVKPENTFVVGDSYERDIVPSKILGCKTIWLKNKSFRESENTESADYIVNNLGDILRYLT
ncbi:MAG: HAD family hydrolase [Ignavibacteriae bacterium]|nr:HAD family hydrolase [Ignavibacteriota bacterium]